jgi:hypothetical protein
MVFMLAAMLGVYGIFAFAHRKNKKYPQVYYSLCTKMILRFLQTAPVLFGSCAMVAEAPVLAAFAFGKHFVLEYDIVFLFSSMILIRYHRLTTDKAPALLFSVSF